MGPRKARRPGEPRWAKHTAWVAVGPDSVSYGSTQPSVGVHVNSARELFTIKLIVVSRVATAMAAKIMKKRGAESKTRAKTAKTRA